MVVLRWPEKQARMTVKWHGWRVRQLNLSRQALKRKCPIRWLAHSEKRLRVRKPGERSEYPRKQVEYVLPVL